MRAEDRRMISCWRLAVALPHSAISATVRPQPVQTLALSSSAQISLQGDGGRLVITPIRIRRVKQSLRTAQSRYLSLID